ncbi:ABC transporter ATP-binding protein [Shewanella glacialipiscicola]|uniref:ABC transporter ATP-binding protein n=1 Tax=Shewanella glacialipiscicola TaxID=614069 RepID=A0ABQ6J366_9GAMM|nr:ABC transporter ATP-binding protein [Shewanella glacialipiscicola]MCL1086923.1 ABC transporter ATP-binding protein [Shewanella glacialipiscicola]MCU7994517.1 ABC transporter ATP-binding protein [Shewanella glacialipiscicola]MCU8025988.1 ABC transporter ATP-binding protein [Shewanella glacialipiscicola]GIU18499.1 ABC transporter ATP-binding protein [Shewanella glacialipiscicola]GMA82568.1 ABC transporter ATP-binding protein [Shewanella glacialipiscicola]
MSNVILKNSAINVVNLEKSVTTQEGTLTILNGINLDVKQGESVAILGPSGSGKSTLLGLLAALDTPTSGEIWLDGVALSKLNEEQKAALRKQKVSFIFQSFMLVDTLTALENVMLPAELAGVRNAKDKAQAMLTRVGLSHRLTHLPKQLSGGEQQRVAIARAFICEPKVLFADEPTGNLDSVNGHKIADMLFELNQESHTTLILVTHDLLLAKRCQRQLVMDNGHLQEDNSASLRDAETLADTKEA